MPLLDTVEVDDVIPKLYQDQIEAELTSDRMAWYFRLEPGRTVSDYSRFTNTVFPFEDPNPAPSPVTALLLPVLEKNRSPRTGC